MVRVSEIQYGRKACEREYLGVAKWGFVGCFAALCCEAEFTGIGVGRVFGGGGRTGGRRASHAGMRGLTAGTEGGRLTVLQGVSM